MTEPSLETPSETHLELCSANSLGVTESNDVNSRGYQHLEMDLGLHQPSTVKGHAGLSQFGSSQDK